MVAKRSQFRQAKLRAFAEHIFVCLHRGQTVLHRKAAQAEIRLRRIEEVSGQQHIEIHPCQVDALPSQRQLRAVQIK
ncbi:hypothetical protein D3C85_1541550 [compost metagenome]